jgi:hypothetical protein
MCEKIKRHAGVLVIGCLICVSNYKNSDILLLGGRGIIFNKNQTPKRVVFHVIFYI